MFDRRGLLKGLIVLGAAPFARRARASEPGPLIQLASRPPNYESTRAAFGSRITPLERFYIRSHFDTPLVDPAIWRLSIGGLVERPLTFSLAELESMPQATIEAVLQCAGNGRALFRPRVPGVQWTRGAMGNATWTGVRLADLLRRARPKPSARHLQLGGADRPSMDNTPRFLRGIPLDKGLDPDTLVATRMNGRPLARDHGAPARLVVPGWVADDWIKWLTEIELLAAEPDTFFYRTGYRFPIAPVEPGAAVPPEQMAPMTSFGPKSIVASPAPGTSLPLGEHRVAGVAFSGLAVITKVEISADGGSTWAQAELDGTPTRYGFRIFEYAWRATRPGRAVLASRASDGAGNVQPITPAWNPGGYLYNAIDPVAVEVIG
jgi:DMSO/TMAO reductase YedYZ molybdopterin-dependent catalytic subunit